ncbi:DUF4350 domain-containing protein [Natrarchaeobius chitinivorans]|uniref:DUF4350 domain-containing protein n=1 Tax=Natrarchaeobius chitinivorans TaxID=1679083 RepID=A0A3N6MGR2_NATCH|nr:DUF4350 domain-containing protein [Natrarchaeobius chitinivorans]RQG96020.1 DUF4350 domain-containing protein [Natrarchaeobius chitinivorans]
MSTRRWIRQQTGADLEWPRVLLVALGGVLLVTLLVGASMSGTAFGLFNPSWDGTSEFRSAVDDDPETELRLLEDPDRYPTDTANESVAFIVAPEQGYDESSIESIREFLEHGGTVVVLDDRGSTVNPLLSALGGDARIEDGVLMDERNYDRGPAMPVVDRTGDHRYTDDVDQLTLNHAGAVAPGNATPIVSTSDFAYLAASPTAELDSETNVTSYPVATVEPVDVGAVVVISDPSIAINAMYDSSDNAAFLAGLYADHDYVLLDVSHTERLPPLVSLLESIRLSGALQIALGTVTVGLIAVVTNPRARPIRVAVRNRVASWTADSAPPAGKPVGLTDDELASVLRSRHPEWDDERIQRVIAAFNRTRSKGDDE